MIPIICLYKNERGVREFMGSVIFIGAIVALVALLFFSKASFKPLRLIGRIAVRFVVGALFLFCVNLFGESVGIHVPINCNNRSERIIGGSRCSSSYCH